MSSWISLREAAASKLKGEPFAIVGAVILGMTTVPAFVAALATGFPYIPQESVISAFLVTYACVPLLLVVVMGGELDARRGMCLGLLPLAAALLPVLLRMQEESAVPFILVWGVAVLAALRPLFSMGKGTPEGQPSAPPPSGGIVGDAARRFRREVISTWAIARTSRLPRGAAGAPGRVLHLVAAILLVIPAFVGTERSPIRNLSKLQEYVRDTDSVLSRAVRDSTAAAEQWRGLIEAPLDRQAEDRLTADRSRIASATRILALKDAERFLFSSHDLPALIYAEGLEALLKAAPDTGVTAGRYRRSLLEAREFRTRLKRERANVESRMVSAVESQRMASEPLQKFTALMMHEQVESNYLRNLAATEDAIRGAELALLRRIASRHRNYLEQELADRTFWLRNTVRYAFTLGLLLVAASYVRWPRKVSPEGARAAGVQAGGVAMLLLLIPLLRQTNAGTSDFAESAGLFFRGDWYLPELLREVTQDDHNRWQSRSPAALSAGSSIMGQTTDPKLLEAMARLSGSQEELQASVRTLAVAVESLNSTALGLSDSAALIRNDIANVQNEVKTAQGRIESVSRGQQRVNRDLGLP